MDNNDLHHHTPLVTVVFVLIVVSSIVFLWYLKSFAPETQPAMEPNMAQPPQVQDEASSSKTSIDAETEVKTTEEAPIVNPIDGAYTNPF